MRVRKPHTHTRAYTLLKQTLKTSAQSKAEIEVETYSSFFLNSKKFETLYLDKIKLSNKIKIFLFLHFYSDFCPSSPRSFFKK